MTIHASLAGALLLTGLVGILASATSSSHPLAVPDTDDCESGYVQWNGAQGWYEVYCGAGAIECDDSTTCKPHTDQLGGVYYTRCVCGTEPPGYLECCHVELRTQPGPPPSWNVWVFGNCRDTGGENSYPDCDAGSDCELTSTWPYGGPHWAAQCQI